MHKQEKRTSPRIAAEGPAVLQLLGESAEENGPRIQVRVVNASEGGMRVFSPEAMAAGRAVRLEAGDLMLLGEVCYCRAEGEGGGYMLGLLIEQCLSGLDGLQQLIQALTPETPLVYDRSRGA